VIDDLETSFNDILDLPPGKRESRLDELRRQNPELAHAVAGLLRAYAASDDFLSPPPAPAAPARLGKYTIERQLGRGASGIVYLGHDPDLNRPVAIKTLTPRFSLRHKSRLRDEARALAGVVHPNIAQVYSIEDVERSDGQEVAILTMEFVPGMTLAKLLRQGALPIERSLDYGRQIAAALEAAHLRSVVHRDLKPQNIHVTPEGWVKVLDFGLAQWLLPDAEPGDRPTATGGTPGYMSPEQCQGEAVDHKSDLWSFGAVLCECLTGGPVVQGETIAELLAANRSGSIRLDLPASIPTPVITLVRDALESNRERRMASATHARQVLEEELLRLRAGNLAGRTQSDTGAKTVRGERRGNLPRPLSSFIGRHAFLEKLGVALRETPLLTLTGPGGAGKTRTSVEVAARLEPHFQGGVWFIDLTLLNLDDQVPAYTALTMGIRETAGAELQSFARATSAIVESFGRQPGLLILDNCEHLITGVARFVAGMLADPAAPTVLATSRQPLAIAGERVLPLPLLALPPETLAADDAPAPAVESVELFVSRAKSRAPEFAPGRRALGIVNEICRQLDGLPLGIELAASQARALSLDEILNQVKAGRSLTGPSPSAHPRHRSLHDLVDWSYRLLPAKEQALLRSLSVFRGGWTLGLLEAVVGGSAAIERWEVCDLLTHLVDRSLVEPEVIGLEKRAEFQPARYRLLETIRGFAAERLAAADGEQAEIERRFLETLPDCLAIKPDERSPSRSRWLKRIEPDYANIVRGLELALATDRIDIAFVLSELASYYWLEFGQVVEGIRWMDRVLARREAIAWESQVGNAPEARFLCRAALFAARQHLSEKASSLVGRALALAHEVGDAEVLAQAHEVEGVAYMQAGDGEAAEGAFVESRRLFEKVGNWSGAALPIGNLGVVEGGRRNFAAAKGYFLEYLRISREMGDWFAEAKALQNLGWMAMTLGSFAEARSTFEASLALLQGKEGPSTAMVHQNLGDLCTSLHEFPAARAHLRESCRIRVRTQDRVGLATSIMLLARLADREGNLPVAAEALAGITTLVDRGEIYCSPEQRRSLKAWHEDLVGRMGGEAMAHAVARGEVRDLQGLLALVESP
jgi:non-specific serine/threonine protein kinase